jgi:hypothetical protein
MLELKTFASRLEPGLIYYPNDAFDTFLNGGNTYTGQDILASMISWPRINKNLHGFLPKDLDKNEIDPHIVYVLARADLPKSKILSEQKNINYLTKYRDSIFKNDTYTLYAVKKEDHVFKCILSTDNNIIKADASCASIDLSIYGKNLFWKYYWSNSNEFELSSALTNFKHFDNNLQFLTIESNRIYKYLYAFYIPTVLLPIIIFLNIMIVLLYLLRLKK